MAVNLHAAHKKTDSHVAHEVLLACIGVGTNLKVGGLKPLGRSLKGEAVGCLPIA